MRRAVAESIGEVGMRNSFVEDVARYLLHEVGEAFGEALLPPVRCGCCKRLDCRNQEGDSERRGTLRDGCFVTSDEAAYPFLKLDMRSDPDQCRPNGNGSFSVVGGEP